MNSSSNPKNQYQLEEEFKFISLVDWRHFDNEFDLKLLYLGPTVTKPELVCPLVHMDSRSHKALGLKEQASID
jgi:hypothetical protein